MISQQKESLYENNGITIIPQKVKTCRDMGMSKIYGFFVQLCHVIQYNRQNSTFSDCKTIQVCV